MKSNKLYAAAMLADEIGELKTKVTLVKKVMNDIMNGRMLESTLDCTEPDILKMVFDTYKEQHWKIEIVNDYVMYIAGQLQALETLKDKYYGDGEIFIQDIALLIQEAAQNNGKVSSKKLLSVLGKEFSTDI